MRKLLTIAALIIGISVLLFIFKPKSSDLLTRLGNLQNQAEQGNEEALKELCKYVKSEDLISLEDFEISEELKASCAELR